MNLSIIPIAALLIALMVGGGYYKGHSSGVKQGRNDIQVQFDAYKAEQQKKYTEAVLRHRDIEQQMQAAADAEREKHRDQIRTIDKRLAVALDELRNRPERRTSASSGKVPDTTQTCAGVSGAELARGDAGFLVGYSADAAKQREALRTCEISYEKIRAELIKEQQ